jgi:non-specific serine/threonine protein kinase
MVRRLGADRRPAFVAKSVAGVFDLQESANRPILDTLLAFLKGKHLLIVLDCCEHVVAEAARVTEAMLRACPHVTVLATTREALDVQGEQVYRVPSLSESDAIALFVDRAKAADSRFTLSIENAKIVAKVCRRLDGIALAIELAAARIKMLSVNALADGLNARFDIVTGGSRTALPRQKTLRAMIDWSYDLLSEHERGFFRRLAIFAGSFTLEAATAVCAGDGASEADVLNLIASLVDKSMVQADFVRDEVRYHLLDSIRAYGHEKLVAQGEFEFVASAHASVSLEIAETLELAWEDTPDKVWKLKAEPEIENWRAALRWAFGPTGNVALGQHLVAALRPGWFTLAPSEGRVWIRAGLDSVDDLTPTQIVARLALADAHLAMLAQQYESALPAAQRALALFTLHNDDRGIALAETFVGAARGMRGELEAGAEYLQRALAAFRQSGARRAIGGTLVYVGTLMLSSGDVSTPRALFREALEVLNSVGAARPAAHVALLLAELEHQAGDAAAAARLGRQALTAERALNDLDAVTFDLCNLSAYLIALGRWEEARSHAREALSLALERQIASALVWALQHLAAISALRPSRSAASANERRSLAARLIGFVDARLGALKLRRDFTEQTEYERILAALQGASSRHQEEGRAWTEARAAEEARLILTPELKLQRKPDALLVRSANSIRTVEHAADVEQW